MMYKVRYFEDGGEVVFGIYFDKDQAERVARYMNYIDWHNYWVQEVDEIYGT